MGHAIAHVREDDRAEQPLSQHLRNVGLTCGRLAAKIGLPIQGELMGLLHDVGKYSAEFQSYIRSAVGLINPDEDEYVDAGARKGKIDHSTAGAQFLYRDLSTTGNFGRFAGQVMALGLVSHHSGMIDCISPDGRDTFFKRIKKDYARTHLVEVEDKADKVILDRVRLLLSQPESVNAVRVFSSAIAKGDLQPGIAPFDNGVTQFKFGLFIRYLYSCLLDADRIDSANFEKPTRAKHQNLWMYESWDMLVKRLEEHIGTFKSEVPIDGIRKEISERCRSRACDPKGVFTLTVPTGGGKTLASLRFSLHHAKEHKLDRIIFVIPFTTIIDQNAATVRKILEPADTDAGSIVLEHHSNLLPNQETWKGKLLAENWDAPVVFTTTIQFLECLFGAGTRDARRMHQLARSILVFDEIQTLPVRCVHLFCNAINFLVDHCGSSVVLCTATQPLLHAVNKTKGRLSLRPNSELMLDVESLFADLKRVEVLDQTRNSGWRNDEIAQLACHELKESGSCLVIVNTKKLARALFSLCIEQNPHSCFHLSTNMCPAHRLKVLKEVRGRLHRNEPAICVSTQLIEAGVDVDFGAVIRCFAGLDSIAQAAGRCNRNGKQLQARVHIVNAIEDSTEMLKDIQIGKQKAERVLGEFKKAPSEFNNDLLSPVAIQRYFQYYFFDRADEMAYRVGPDDVRRNDTLLNLLSTNPMSVSEFSRTSPDSALEGNVSLPQSFMAAAKAFKVIDSPTYGIIVPYGADGTNLIAELCRSRDLGEQKKLLRKAQHYTVDLYLNILEKLRSESALYEAQPRTGIFYLDERYYSEDFGVCTEAVSQSAPLIF